jgi:hypothetical protein
MASNNKKPAQPHLKIKDLKTKKNPIGGKNESPLLNKAFQITSIK